MSVNAELVISRIRRYMDLPGPKLLQDQEVPCTGPKLDQSKKKVTAVITNKGEV